MKAHLKFILGTLAFTTLLIGCNEGPSGSNSVQTNFSITGSGQNAVAQNAVEKTFSFLIPSAVALTPAPLVDSNGSNVDLNEAWIVVKHVQFKTSESDDNKEAYSNLHYKGPFYVDLLSDEPISFGEISLPEKELRRVKMLLHKGNSLPENVPSALNGKSIYLNGVVNSYNFTYAADDTTDFAVSGPNAVLPEEEKDLLMVIRIADLIKKIDLSSINGNVSITSSSRYPATNPCPLIHPTANDLYTCFRMGLAQEAKFGKDNGDKDLDSSDDIVNE